MLFLFAGKYYLVDARYPNEYRYLGLYKGKRYLAQVVKNRRGLHILILYTMELQIM